MPEVEVSRGFFVPFVIAVVLVGAFATFVELAPIAFDQGLLDLFDDLFLVEWFPGGSMHIRFCETVGSLLTYVAT